MRGKPHSLDRIKLKQDTRQVIEAEALFIFTEMCNSGYPLREVLAAIYISGMRAGHGAAKEEEDDGG